MTAIEMNNPPGDVWRYIGQYIPQRERFISDVLAEPTYRQREAFEESLARRDYEDLLGDKGKISRDDSWTYNYGQMSRIIDILSDDRYAHIPQFYVYNTIPYFVPEYMTDLDSVTIFQMEDSRDVLEKIGQNILDTLPRDLVARFRQGLRVIYSMFPAVNPTVINYLILRFGTKIGIYEDQDLYQVLADKGIPVKRVSW